MGCTIFILKNSRIEYVFLPSYNPNLYIVVRLCKFFKKKITYNEYYEKFSVFKKESIGFYQNIEKYKSELQTLMTDNFELIGV